MTQQEKAKQFYDLHHSEELLILPNIWDSLGAALLEDLGYPAIATASASVAYTHGYQDREQIPFDSVLILLKRIVNSVRLPVTVDIESGYAANDSQLQENIRELIATGIVGINLEDTNRKTNSLFSIEEQCNRIRLVKKVSEEMGVSLFINGRTDVYLYEKDFVGAEEKLEETIKRALAYKAAGADCFFPVLIREQNEIKRLIEQIQMPVNIILFPGVPELKVLHEIVVARVSLGPSFLKIAMKAMKDIALKLQRHEGLSDIIENDVTSDYLKMLVSKK